VNFGGILYEALPAPPPPVRHPFDEGVTRYLEKAGEEIRERYGGRIAELVKANARAYGAVIDEIKAASSWRIVTNDEKSASSGRGYLFLDMWFDHVQGTPNFAFERFGSGLRRSDNAKVVSWVRYRLSEELESVPHVPDEAQEAMTGLCLLVAYMVLRPRRSATDPGDMARLPGIEL
jgi:hypothetical protein